MNDQPDTNRGVYGLMRWEGGAWTEKARGPEPYDLGRDQQGSPGDDWTIRCMRCGKDSKFYGCTPCSTSARKEDGDG